MLVAKSIRAQQMGEFWQQRAGQDVAASFNMLNFSRIENVY
jgi:hypothetical protein